MTTVQSVFNHRPPRLSSPHPKIAFNAGVGIELEVEGVSHIDVPLWNCTEDGSLRNGCELVCANPYSGVQLYEAIENLSEAVTRSGAQGTWRCSTHVHLDVRDCDDNTLKKVILAWAFYEKLLFKCSGFHRYRSNFCPAFAVVQAQLLNASIAFNHSGENFFHRLVSCWDKYTSLNLLPLMQFGSVEFRISEPKWKRTNLLNLVNRFLTLKKLAVENSHLTHQAFIDMLRDLGFSAMMEYLPLDYMLDQRDLDDGYILANDVLNVRARETTVVSRVTLNVLNAEAIDNYVVEDVRSVLNNWTHYAGHCVSKNELYANIFREIFSTGSPRSVDSCNLGMISRLIEEWKVIAQSRADTDSEINEIILSNWTNELSRFIENL